MTESEHVPELCQNCGGLTITRWDRIEGITSIKVGGLTLQPSKVWIAKPPEPCTQPNDA